MIQPQIQAVCLVLAIDFGCNALDTLRTKVNASVLHDKRPYVGNKKLFRSILFHIFKFKIREFLIKQKKYEKYVRVQRQKIYP